MSDHDVETINDGSPISCSSCTPGTRGVLAWSLVAAGLLIVASLVLESTELALMWQLLIVLIPVVPFAVMLIAMVRMSRRLDEMQRRVQLEALGLCVVLAAGTCVLIGQFQKIDVLGEMNMSMGMVAIVASYALSYAFVARRYFK